MLPDILFEAMQDMEFYQEAHPELYDPYREEPEVLKTLMRRQQFPLIALQPLPVMSMGQLNHPCWLDACQTVITIGNMLVSKQVHFMLWANPTPDDWKSPS
jgi:hypothetical protein